MDKKNMWWQIMLLFLVVVRGNNDWLINLLYADDFDNEFNILVNKLRDFDSDEFKNSCINGLVEKKDVIRDLNKAYKGIKKNGK